MVRSLLTLLLASFALLAGCDSKSPAAAAAGEKRLIVCTTGMIADIARSIAGDRAEVVSLMGEGVDPHLYKPTRSDMSMLSRADLVLYTGLLLEGKMTETLERIRSSGKAVHAVTDDIPKERLMAPAEFEGHPDPHVWMDPALWSIAAGTIRDRLVAIDPAGEAAYRAAAAAYLDRLGALQAYSQRVLASVPEPARALVTAHDAFNYFGKAYGYEVVGIQGISTESEAGVQDIERLVELLVSRKVPAVFVETTVSSRNINALIAGAKARGHTVSIGGSLYSDAMGAAGTYDGTYVGMIDHNVTTIARALGGQVPERGFRGETEAATP